MAFATRVFDARRNRVFGQDGGEELDDGGRVAVPSVGCAVDRRREDVAAERILAQEIGAARNQRTKNRQMSEVRRVMSGRAPVQLTLGIEPQRQHQLDRARVPANHGVGQRRGLPIGERADNPRILAEQVAGSVPVARRRYEQKLWIWPDMKKAAYPSA